MYTQSSQRKNEVYRSSGLDLFFAQDYKTLSISSLSRHVNRVENRINRYNKIKGCHVEVACILNHLSERTKFLGPLGLDLFFAQDCKTLSISSLSRHVNRVENRINRYNKIKGCHVEVACILNHLSERTKFLGPLDWIYSLHKITRLSPILTSLVM